MQGEWDLSDAACADPESQSGLTVTADRLQLYESGGDVLRITSSADGKVDVVLDWADVNVEAADETPLPEEKSARLTPSEDRSRLVVFMDGESWEVVRCSGSPA